MLDSLIPLGPGQGPQWQRLAEWLRERISVSEVDGIWVLRTVRRDRNEYGTAILSLVAGDRRRICTCSYVATIKGKTRGGFEALLTEVGSGPLEALHELLSLVPVRSDDEDPPLPVDVVSWFPPEPEVTDAGDSAGGDAPAIEEPVESGLV